MLSQEEFQSLGNELGARVEALVTEYSRKGLRFDAIAKILGAVSTDVNNAFLLSSFGETLKSLQEKVNPNGLPPSEV